MPLYGVAQAGGVCTQICAGDQVALFASTDTVTAPQASIAICRGRNASQTNYAITFQILYGSSPTAVMEILATNVSQYPGKTFNLAEWTVVYTSTNVQTDSYTDIGASEFYCAYLVSQSGGGTPSVTAQAA